MLARSAETLREASYSCFIDLFKCGGKFIATSLTVLGQLYRILCFARAKGGARAPSLDTPLRQMPNMTPSTSQSKNRAVADPGGYLLYPWIPPFWLAMYNRPVFSTEDHHLLRSPLLDKWIQKATEQLTYEYFERILSSNATSNLEHAIFYRKWAWLLKISNAHLILILPFYKAGSATAEREKSLQRKRERDTV